MSDLLALKQGQERTYDRTIESVKTEKLEESSNKYLPSVMNEEGIVRTKKDALSESVKTEHTGNRSLDGQTAQTTK